MNDETRNLGDEPYVDPVIEHYMKYLDTTLIDETLKLTPNQRVRNLQAAVRDLERLRNAMIEAKAKQAG
jgi:hypothetical protein